MVHSMKKRYEELKKHKNIIVNYDDILLYYPDYYKTKIELEKEKFISKEKVDKIFNENYKETKLFKNLNYLAMDKDEIYNFMNQNKDIKFKTLNELFNKLVKSSIDLCELIDYIGHYPSTWPVPKEEEKNQKMEEYLEKYDIIVRYHLDDELDCMQIMSDDIVRIIDRLTEYLSLIKDIKTKTNDNNWMFTFNRSVKDQEKNLEAVLNKMNEFPLSDYQERNLSKREEGKHYLRLQHGKNII